MFQPRSGSITAVLELHFDECVSLCVTRAVTARAPHVGLDRLGRIDERLAAHLDGLLVANGASLEVCDRALASPGAGELFTTTVLAILHGDSRRLVKLLAVAALLPEACDGVMAAFGWVSPASLQGTIRSLLGSSNGFHRRMGIAACGLHRVDPAEPLVSALADPDPALRATALRVCGECARDDLRAACLDAQSDETLECRLEAACAALLLGDRGRSLRCLQQLCLAEGPIGEQAMRWLLAVLQPERAVPVLKQLSGDASGQRRLLMGMGCAGDPSYVPYLIDRMQDLALARLAGESFSLIAGADLPALDLDRKPPAAHHAGPDDDPENDDVALDEDEGLAWPDPVRAHAWWEANRNRFAPGIRHFVGARPTRTHCLQVLRGGLQRQRLLAARYLAMIKPANGRLFNCEAPAWRQQRWLGQMQ